MPRSRHADPRRKVMLLMLVFVGLMFFLWPHVRTTTSLPFKTLLTLLPIVPMGAALWLIATDIVRSDEMQQRAHLIAMSLASGITAAVTFIAGFLCAAGVLALGGDDLMFVLPLISVSYAASNWMVSRRYGNVGC